MTEDPEPELGTDPDSQLRRLFCDAVERGSCELLQVPDTADAAFTARVSALVRRGRRWRWISAALAASLTAVGVATLAAWTAPMLTRAWTDLARSGTDVLPQLSGWFASPAGWGCSVAVALLVVWRTRAFRR